MQSYLSCLIFQTGQENTPGLTAVSGPNLYSTKPLLELCSVKLDIPPLEPAVCQDLQNYGNTIDKQGSDYTAGNHYGHVLGDNLSCKSSPTLNCQSLNKNEEFLKNNYAKLGGNLERQVDANCASENSCNQKHVKSLPTSIKPFQYNESDFPATKASNMNGAEYCDKWQCQWPDNYIYTLSDGNEASRLTNFKCLDDIKDFVVLFSEMNDLSFMASYSRINKDGSMNRKYKCHYGACAKSR